MSTQQDTLFRQVYVDLDDVVAQAAVGFTDVVRELFGRGVPFQDIFSFDLGKSFGLSKVELARFLRAAFVANGRCATSGPRARLRHRSTRRRPAGTHPAARRLTTISSRAARWRERSPWIRAAEPYAGSPRPCR